MRTAFYHFVICAGLLAAWGARADTPQATPADLGGERFTLIGAERQGNAQGTIPAWTGGLTAPPAGYRPGEHEADPFADDEILYAITAANAGDHKQLLSPGQQGLLAAYPDTWQFKVYPTRRSASYPSWVNEAVAANASRAFLAKQGKGGARGSRIGSPFPTPTNGEQVVWNHNLRWRGIRVQRALARAAVTRSGRYTLVLGETDLGFPYGARVETPFTKKYPNLMLAIKQKVVAPALLANEANLVIEPIDHSIEPRKAWTYNEALRRVVRTPLFQYGLPAPNSDSLRTVDEFELFNGPTDYFEWRLLGKREMLIAYNAYGLHSGEVRAADIVRSGHINPDLARYELHRVWVVEGTLKPGKRHVYSKRVFYVDEDSWSIAASDSYDAQGKLWRTADAHAVNFYTVPVHLATLYVYHDLRSRRYLIDGLDNARKPWTFLEGGDPREFSPNSLLYYVR
jgi:hypothetical protein